MDSREGRIDELANKLQQVDGPIERQGRRKIEMGRWIRTWGFEPRWLQRHAILRSCMLGHYTTSDYERRNYGASLMVFISGYLNSGDARRFGEVRGYPRCTACDVVAVRPETDGSRGHLSCPLARSFFAF